MPGHGTSDNSSSSDSLVNVSVNVNNSSQSVIISKKKYTQYEVTIHAANGRQWSILRRYNDFSKLHESMKKEYPELHLKIPGKRLWGNNFATDFLKTRRQGLQEFLQKLLSDERTADHPKVRAFLQVDENCERNSSLPSSEHDDSPHDDSSPESDSKKSSDRDESISSHSRSVDLGPSERRNVSPKDFQFTKVIGKGSFGKVMVATHIKENKSYAVKVLNKKTILKRNEKTHIMCERNVLLKNLNHPFLVGLHYSFQTREKLYFVLDLVLGGELFHHLQKERYFEEGRARFYAAEITCALGYLHSQGIVYRDLKPENILLDREGHIVLTDFGLCKDGLRSRDSTTNTFCGTPEYLAPEVLQREAYDRCVDWWCLGAVLYEMLYGLPPFYSRDTSEMYDNILHKPVKLRSNISTAARSILEGLLQKDKNKRLGAENDADEIKQHAFFKQIDWDALEKKEIEPPFKPNLRGHNDLKYIDPEFTSEPVPASVAKSPATLGQPGSPAAEAFVNFTYIRPTPDVLAQSINGQ